MNREEMQAHYFERNAEVERLLMEARAAGVRDEATSQSTPAPWSRRIRLGNLRHIFGLS